MKISRKIEIERLADTLLAQIYPLKFPMRASALLKHLQESYNITLVKFTEIAQASQIPLKEVCKKFCTENARIIFDNTEQMYYVFYNDTMPKERCRWNIIHELAHLYLGHLLLMHKAKTLNVVLGAEELEELEQEANYFTSYFTAPYPLIMFLASHYNLLSFNGYYAFARSLFGYSKEAAYYRARNLSNRSHTQISVKSFEPFISFIIDFIEQFPQEAIDSLAIQKYVAEIPAIEQIVEHKQKGYTYKKRFEYWTISEIIEEMARQESAEVNYA